MPGQAIFLSYSSDDAEAARRICEALRAAGLEVWFDQSELRGGDAWDASIRKQIKECALFVPMISASTNAREEGYFRLEWKLAVDRSQHGMIGAVLLAARAALKCGAGRVYAGFIANTTHRWSIRCSRN